MNKSDNNNAIAEHKRMNLVNILYWYCLSKCLRVKIKILFILILLFSSYQMCHFSASIDNVPSSTAFAELDFF